MEEEMVNAGKEERDLAFQHGDFFQGVLAITIICDGGWSKRTHKHSYNAMGGVWVIFGARIKNFSILELKKNSVIFVVKQTLKTYSPGNMNVFKIGMNDLNQWRLQLY